MNAKWLLLQVLLRFRTATITCGGSLVRGADGNIVIVTAAHCVDGYLYFNVIRIHNLKGI